MGTRNIRVLLHLAAPVVGTEVRDLLRELASLVGVARIVPGAKVPRVLAIDYDPSMITAETLVSRARRLPRRRWPAAQLVGMRRADALGPLVASPRASSAVRQVSDSETLASLDA